MITINYNEDYIHYITYQFIFLTVTRCEFPQPVYIANFYLLFHTPICCLFIFILAIFKNN